MLSLQKSLIVLLLLFSRGAYSQTDSTFQKKKWYIPTGITLEYAGGFGMLSAGVVYKTFKKTELSITAGYTPPAYGNIWTTNFLFSYSPFNLPVTKKIAISPLKIGVFTSFHFGDNLYIIRPNNYPSQYYWWSSSIRFGPFVEADLNYALMKHKSITFFFQCSTNDLYLSSYLTNLETISLGDILVFGTGGKFNF